MATREPKQEDRLAPKKMTTDVSAGVDLVLADTETRLQAQFDTLAVKLKKLQTDQVSTDAEFTAVRQKLEAIKLLRATKLDTVY